MLRLVYIEFCVLHLLTSRLSKLKKFSGLKYLVMKKGFYLFLVLIALLSSCSKDSNNEPDPVNDDSDPVNYTLEITVDEIDYFSALVIWNVGSADPTGFEFSVYLDDQLIAEGLTSSSYQISDLEHSTSYNVKVMAENPETAVEDTTTFQTLEFTGSLRLVNYDFVPYDLNWGLTYDEMGKLTGKTRSPGTSRTEIDYNENGNWTNVVVYLQDFATAFLSYTYVDNELDELTIQDGFSGGDVVRFDYTSISPTSYTYERRNLEIGSFDEYRTDLTLDSEGRVLSYHQIDLATQETYRTGSFEYDNGNLVKAIFGNGNEFEFIYDDHPSFHTYPSIFMPVGLFGGWGASPFDFTDIAGLTHLDGNDEFYYKVKFIPYFMTHRNKNNPIAYLKNGVEYVAFEYEYNEFGYPSQMNASVLFNEDIALTYEVID